MALKHNFKWTPEKVKAVKNKLLDFFDETELYSGESVQQSDVGGIEGVDILGEIADIMFEDVEIDYESGS